MAAIPKNRATKKDLELWYELQKQISELKNKETLLRQKIFGYYFEDAKEGTNTFDLQDGFLLKGKRVVNRTLDYGVFQANVERFRKIGITPEDLVRMKPELELKAYRGLSADQQKVFDECLVIKDGMPSLEIVENKKGKK